MFLEREIFNRICEVLDKKAGPVHRAGAGRWRGLLSNGTSTALSVRLEDDWLLLSAEIPDGIDSADFSHAVRLNGSFRGLARLVLPSGRPGTQLCADIPLEDAESLQVRLGEACESMRHALEWIEGVPQDMASDVSDAGQDGESRGMKELSTEIGWPTVERGPSGIAFELAVPDGLENAFLEVRGETTKLYVQLIGIDERWSALSRDAMAIYLLKVASAVHLVRPAVVKTAGSESVQLQVEWASRPAVFELRHALEALSAVCRYVAGPLTGLIDQEVARTYLYQHAPVTIADGVERRA